MSFYNGIEYNHHNGAHKCTHKFACQNSTQKLLDHMYPIPERFAVDPKYLLGITEDEFIDGFICLWNVVQNTYKDMIEKPADYGFLCVADQEPNSQSSAGKEYRLWNESKGSPAYLMSYFALLCQIGKLQDNSLAIPFNTHEENIKKISPKMSKTVSHTLVKRLMDFGFHFTGFNGETFDKGIDSFFVTYENNKNLLTALKGFCIAATNLRGDKFRCVQYHLVAAPGSIPEPADAFAFGQNLPGNERAFFTEFNKRMIEEGFICDSNDFDTTCIRYCTEKQLTAKNKPWLVRCFSNHNQLDMVIKMFNIASYDKYLDTLPDRVKASYKRARPCNKCGDHYLTCSHRYAFSLDGEEYAVDLYGGYGAQISDFNIDDVELYVSLIKREAKVRQ